MSTAKDVFRPTHGSEEAIIEMLAHCLLWGSNSYRTPQDFAVGVLKRIDHDGYQIVPKPPINLP